MMGLSLQVELVCEETKTTKLKQLTLKSEPRTFLEIKKEIEKSFSIPVCVQDLLHQSHKVADTDSPLQCYLRDGDTIQVTYPMEGECERVIQVVEWLKKLENALTPGNYKVYAMQFSNHEYIDMTNEMSFCLLYPWINSTKYVNKLHFNSIGGVKTLMNVYKCIVDARVQRKTLHEAKFLESKCALFVANFTHTFPLRRRIIEFGGLDLCISSFLSLKFVTACRYGSLCEAVRASLYGLCNISELPEVQLKLAQRRDVTEQAINVAMSPLFSCDTAIVSLMYFICLAQCPEAHIHLSQLSVVKGLFKVCETRRAKTVAADHRYKTLKSYACVVLAMMVLRSMNYLLKISNPLTLMNKIIKLMESVCQWNPADILGYEVQEGLVWATFLPQLTYLYHPMPLCLSDPKELPYELFCSVKTLHTLSTTVLLRALLNAFTREMHVNVLVKEEVLDYIVALPWHVPDSCRDLAMDVLKTVSKSVQIKPPSLCSLTKVKLAKCSTGLKRVMDMRSVADLF